MEYSYNVNIGGAPNAVLEEVFKFDLLGWALFSSPQISSVALFRMHRNISVVSVSASTPVGYSAYCS